MSKRLISLLIVFVCCISLCACASTPTIKIPDIQGLDVDTAKTLLVGKGLIPKIEYVYDNNYDYGIVIKTNPAIGSAVEEDTPVKVFVCKGPAYYELASSLGAFSNIDGIEPFVSWTQAENGIGTKGHTKVWAERGYLYISVYLGCKSEYNVEFYGNFGEASINDTFDKTVPIEVIYTSKQIDNTGERTYFDFKIPLSDLGVQKPTNISIRYYLKVDGVRKTGEADFDLSW